jgi:hypothetical protein
MKDVCVIFTMDSIILSFIDQQGILCFIEARTIKDLIKLSNLILIFEGGDGKVTVTKRSRSSDN